MFETIEIDIDTRGVATLTLNRPDKHNALSAQMLAELTQAARDLGADDVVRVVVLRGAGKSFCAGGDLGWMREQMQADSDTRAREAGKLAYMLQALNTLPKPLIGALHGNAFGGRGWDGIGLRCRDRCGSHKDGPDRDAPWYHSRHHWTLCAGAHGRRTGAARVHVCSDI